VSDFLGPGIAAWHKVTLLVMQEEGQSTPEYWDWEDLVGLDTRVLATEQAGEVRWYLNEEGEPYAYPSNLQADVFPNDLHVPFLTHSDAAEASRFMNRSNNAQ